MLRDDTCYVEMGAGRGHVNHWIQRALGNETKAKFVLVDRQGVRYKMDAQHRDENEGPKFHRLRMDIQHLHLPSVPLISEMQNNNKPSSNPSRDGHEAMNVESSNGHPQGLTVVSKHLCGAATDLTLRCVIGCGASSSSQGLGDVTLEDMIAPVIDGIVIALCCHHRVEYRSYVGHKYLESLGFEPAEFWLLRSLSSWATCGFEKKRVEVQEDGDEGKAEYDKDSDSIFTPEAEHHETERDSNEDSKDF